MCIRIRILVVCLSISAVLLLYILTGCSETSPQEFLRSQQAHIDFESGYSANAQFSDTMIEYIVILNAQLPGMVGTRSRQTPDLRYQYYEGDYKTKSGCVFTISLRTWTGDMTIGEEFFNVANGRVFLTDVEGEKVTTRQLQAGIDKETGASALSRQLVKERIERLVESNATVREFLNKDSSDTEK